MSAAFLAEGPLRPVRRCVDGDVIAAVELDVSPAVNRQQRASAPPAAVTAMTSADLLCFWGGETDSAAQAMTVHGLKPLE
jgi:hypothetical protein